MASLESEQKQDTMSNNDGIPAENLSQASPPAVATASARTSVATDSNEQLDNSVIILASLQVGSLPHDTWVRARANFAEPKCVLVEGLQTHGFA